MNAKKQSGKESSTQVPNLPTTIPFNEDQKQWLAGFFAGLHSQLLNSAPKEAEQGKPLTIIYGSQTGNAESIAELAADQAKTEGLLAQVFDMDDIEVEQLIDSERLMVITSTYGEGEMPDNAELLWEAIAADDAPNFGNTFFSVLALGDTSYDEFCLAGKLWDQRLEELGAQRIAERVDCDVDFDTPAQQWLDEAIPQISKHGSQETKTASVTNLSNEKAKSKKFKYTRKDPLSAKLLNKRILSGDGSSKEIVHYELSIAGSGEVYKAGDTLNVVARNQANLVAALLDYFGKDANYRVTGLQRSVVELFTEELEIRTPSKELVKHLASISKDDEFRRIVEQNDTETLADFLWGKDSLSLLQNYASTEISIEDFVSSCKPLIPRAYSISSSINKHPDEVHLTIGSVRYHADNRDQLGVASTYLADFLNVDERLECYFSPNKHFAVPSNPAGPIIMVGPGTGIAPFRAFLEEREASKADGDNWLFFGDRNSTEDFIYQEEIEAWQESGLITKLDLAFSRDQQEKIYVQHRMIEQGEDLFAWLERGAYFYVCGDASRMAKDVDAALHEVVGEHGKLSEEQAKAYVGALKKSKRYVRDVY